MDLDSIIRTAREQDAWAAVDAICAHADALAATRVFRQVMRHLYWKDKNLPDALTFGQAGAAFSLAAARHARLDGQPSAEPVTELLGMAKGFLYDLASFAWPGWDEPGIIVQPGEASIGAAAARANLRMARELNKGDLPLSRAHWMLGGHLLAARDFGAAQAEYLKGAAHARNAPSRADELLNHAFEHLCTLLERGQPLGESAVLKQIFSELNGLTDGPMFVAQVEAAHRVFSRAVP